MTTRRTFLLTVPVVAVLASRLPRAQAFMDFGLQGPVTLHGAEAVWSFGTCEACGAPATHLWRDEIDISTETEERYELGDLHRGCAAHYDLAIGRFTLTESPPRFITRKGFP